MSAEAFITPPDPNWLDPNLDPARPLFEAMCGRLYVEGELRQHRAVEVCLPVDRPVGGDYSEPVLFVEVHENLPLDRTTATIPAERYITFGVLGEEGKRRWLYGFSGVTVEDKRTMELVMRAFRADQTLHRQERIWLLNTLQAAMIVAPTAAEEVVTTLLDEAPFLTNTYTSRDANVRFFDGSSAQATWIFAPSIEPGMPEHVEGFELAAHCQGRDYAFWRDEFGHERLLISGVGVPRMTEPGSRWRRYDPTLRLYDQTGVTAPTQGGMREIAQLLVGGFRSGLVPAET